MEIDFAELSRSRVYAAMTQAIIPRPVAWVLSENPDGGHNLAPFSYFNAVSSDPPLIMLSIGRKPDGTEKDTRVNIRERDAFVVHIPSRAQAEAVTASSAGRAHGESEVAELGLALTAFEGSPLPRLADCPIALACRRYQVIELGPPGQALILGEVIRLHADEEVVRREGEDWRIDAAAVDPLGRLGGNDYSGRGERISGPHPG